MICIDRRYVSKAAAGVTSLTEPGGLTLQKKIRERQKLMNRADAMEQAVRAYEAYYDVNRETPEEPFFAEASFHSHEDAFFLVHGAVIGESESNEYVFFASEESLDLEDLKKLDSLAWDKGTARVKPHGHHRNTDISLIILADQVTEEARKAVRGLKHYKSYRFSLQGFSHYRLLVVDLTEKKMFWNRQGSELRKSFHKILK